MNVLIRRLNRNMTLSSAAIMVAASSIIGIILGILRTKLVNANFNNFSTGAYFAAFKIPDLIFYTLAAGALSVAFIPVLTDKMVRSSRKDAWLLTSSVLNSVSLVMAIVCLLLVIFPRPILEYIVVPGFSPERLDIAAQIMRLVAINTFVFSVSSILGSVQQAFDRFFFFAVAPLFYNLSIIVSIYLFKDSMGVVGLGVGVAIGALLNLLILGCGMSKLSFRHVWAIHFKEKGFLQVMRALPLRSFDQGIIYINYIVQTRIASSISIHAVTNFENALILYGSPVILLGAALGTASFPRFAKRISQNRIDLFHRDFLGVLRAMIWLTIPIVAVSYFCRDFMARIIFARDNREIALIFGWCCLGILFRSMFAIVSRFYYAQKDILTPLLVTILVFISNIGLSWALAARYGVVGLGIATSLVALIEIATLLIIIHVRQRHLFDREFLRGMGLMLVIGTGTAGVAFLASSWLPLAKGDTSLILLVKLGAITIATAGMHFLASYVLHLKEARRLLVRLKEFGVKLRRIIA